MGDEAPGQTRLSNREMQRIAIYDFSHAHDSSMSLLQVVAGIIPTTTSQIIAFQEIVILPMEWRQENVVELSSEQQKTVLFRQMMKRRATRQTADVMQSFCRRGGGLWMFVCSFFRLLFFRFFTNFAVETYLSYEARTFIVGEEEGERDVRARSMRPNRFLLANRLKIVISVYF